MQLSHKISDQIRIEEEIEKPTFRDKVQVFHGAEFKTFTMPIQFVSLKLYKDDNFVCSLSYACYQHEEEIYRSDRIGFLLKHYETVQS